MATVLRLQMQCNPPLDVDSDFGPDLGSVASSVSNVCLFIRFEIFLGHHISERLDKRVAIEFKKAGVAIEDIKKYGPKIHTHTRDSKLLHRSD